MIQYKSLYLFESDLTDPFIFPAIGGVDITMNAVNDGLIDSLVIDNVAIKVNSCNKLRASFGYEFRGIENQPFNNIGQLSQNNIISFILSDLSDINLDKLIGKRYCFILEDFKGGLFACFAKTKTEQVTKDNFNSVKIMFKPVGIGKLYKVSSLSIGSIGLEL